MDSHETREMLKSEGLQDCIKWWGMTPKCMEQHSKFGNTAFKSVTDQTSLTTVFENLKKKGTAKVFSDCKKAPLKEQKPETDKLAECPKCENKGDCMIEKVKFDGKTETDVAKCMCSTGFKGRTCAQSTEAYKKEVKKKDEKKEQAVKILVNQTKIAEERKVVLRPSTADAAALLALRSGAPPVVLRGVYMEGHGGMSWGGCPILAANHPVGAQRISSAGLTGTRSPCGGTLSRSRASHRAPIAVLPLA